MARRPTTPNPPGVPARPQPGPPAPTAMPPNPFGPPFPGPLAGFAQGDNPFGSNPQTTLAVSAPAPARPQYTGRQIILLPAGAADDARRALHNKAGLTLHKADRDMVAAAADPHGPSALPRDQGVLFERLGVAVVYPEPDKTALLGTLAVQEASMSSVEWERFVYSTSVDTGFLLGYRAGVDRLVEQLLRGDDGVSAAASAGGTKGFVDDGRFTWGLRAIGVDATRFTGRDVAVAVLDTGIDLTHPDLMARVAGHQSFVDGQDVQDLHGHGTHCAGIACGPATPMRMPRYAVAPDARLFVGKVLGNDGVGTDTSILGGITWALDQGCSVISMSLGSPTVPGQSTSAAFEQIGNRVLDAGSMLIAAAGNDSRRPGQVASVSHPANCRSIAAVAAVDAQLRVAFFSNAGLTAEGGQIDTAGPGVDCLSTWVMPMGYRVESGTSMATPHVAGLVALFAEANPGVRGRALLNLVCQHAQRLAAASRDVGGGLAMAP